MVSLAGSAFGAGTFASFSATTTNAGSSFASGTLVLNDNSPTQASCLSTVSASPTTGQVDANANSCSAAFTLATKKPGDSSTAAITITNTGTTDASTGGTNVVVYGSAACQDGLSGSVNGSGSLCGAVQTYIQQSSPVALCRYGKGASGVINVAVTTGTVAAQAYKLTIDSTVHDNIALGAATYTQASLLTAVNAGISAWATAAIDPGGIMWITSKTTGASSNATIAAPTTGTSALGTLGFGSGSPVLTNNTTGITTCSFDGVHTMAHLGTITSAANGFAAGALAVGGGGNVYSIGVQLPTSAGNSLQGLSASLGYSWTAQ